MLSVWKHFNLCNPLLLGEGKDFVQAGLGGLYFFWNVLFICFCKGDAPSFLSLCIFLPPAAHTWAGLWLLLPCSAGQDGPRSPGSATALPCTGSRRPPSTVRVSRERSRWKQKKKGQKKGLWAIACCDSGRSRALRRLLEWQHTKSLNPLRCASCVHLPICVSKMSISKFTASFRFQGTERKQVRAARGGRSRCLRRLCCCQFVMTLLSAVKLSCPGRTDCKVHLVNVK